MDRPKRTGRSTRLSHKLALLNFHRLPELMEEVEVLWDLDGSLIWWSGEVIQISSNVSQHMSATIRYKPRKKYGFVDYIVQFQRVHVKCGIKRLLHVSPSTDVLTPWKFPDEVVDIESIYPSNKMVDDCMNKQNEVVKTSTSDRRRPSTIVCTPTSENAYINEVKTTNETEGQELHPTAASNDKKVQTNLKQVESKTYL